MKSRIALAVGAGLVVATLSAVPLGSAQAGLAPAATTTDGCLKSVPEPDSTEKVDICYTLFRPAGASRTDRVPFIMHSHGWGGSRTKDPASFQKWLDAGYGVLSFDQRGFGESGGKAHVENPDFEGHDVRRLISFIADLGWVRKDGPGDPRMGAIGGSYGGGYQFLGAFESLRLKGTPVFDALAPEITWYDLKESLAPEEVVRTEWALALSAAGAANDALETSVYKALVEGTATGTWPDGSTPGTENLDEYFKKNGPKWHVEHGRRLDIPVLLGQGTTDTLFPLQQGIANFRNSITPSARAESIFVGYNGGHTLPAIYPRGVEVASDPCSQRLAGGTFEDLALRFMNEKLKGRDTGLRGYGDYHLATPDSTCTRVGSVSPNAAIGGIGQVATTQAAGPAIAYPIIEGPIRIAGNAYLTGTMTALGVNNRAFYGLAVGTSPADAHLVQNNVLPINEPDPVDAEPRRITLPSVAVDVPAGQTLYVIASPVSDTFGGMSSRTPGAVVLDDTSVLLHVVGR
jgi:ABC-2 type transport system ATP-binding protein